MLHVELVILSHIKDNIFLQTHTSCQTFTKWAPQKTTIRTEKSSYINLNDNKRKWGAERERERGTCSDGATGGVEVHVDGLGRVFGFKEEELGDDDVGGVVGDGAVDADDAFLEEAGEDVVGSLSSGGVLDHHRDQAVVADAVALLRELRCSCSMDELGSEQLRTRKETSHG